MPVDAGELDAVVMRRREVAAEGPDRGEEQDRQTDEHVGAVQARQGEEDGRKGVVVRRKTYARVLDPLGQQEREAHEEGQYEPRLEPGAVPAADRLERPVDREARG